MRALVLSGGGSRAAFSVGVLKYLTQYQNRSWNIITGISSGALLGCYISQHKPENQREATESLEDIWRSIEGNSAIYKHWFPRFIPKFVGYISSFYLNGLFNTSPLKKLIKNNFNQKKLLESGNRLFVGAVSAETGKYHFAREYDNNLLDFIVASAAFPVVFPPVMINNEMWMDGGLATSRQEINFLLEQFNKFDITEIDIIATNPIDKNINKQIIKKGGAIGVAINVIKLYFNEDYFTKFLLENIDILSPTIKINIFLPKERININILDFNPKIISNLIKEGFNCAKEIFEKK